MVLCTLVRHMYHTLQVTASRLFASSKKSAAWFLADLSYVHRQILATDNELRLDGPPVPYICSCGLLWRGANDSSLARARRQVEGVEVGGGGGGGAADTTSDPSANATVPDGGGGAGGEEAASYADPRDGQAETEAEAQAELARMQQDMDAAAAAGAGVEGQQQGGHGKEGEADATEGKAAVGEGEAGARSDGGAAAGGDVVIGDQDEEGEGEAGVGEEQGSEVEVEVKENAEQGGSAGGTLGAEVAGTGASQSAAVGADAPPEDGTTTNGATTAGDAAAESRRQWNARLLGESLWGAVTASEARGWGLGRHGPGERGASRSLGGGGDTGLDGAAYPEDLWRLLEEQERPGGADRTDARL